MPLPHPGVRRIGGALHAGLSGYAGRRVSGRALAAIAVSIALGASTSAQAATAPGCISRKQASALMAYALPDIITGTAARCRQALGTGAYLATHAAELAQRYGRDRAAYWPEARSAFLEFARRNRLDQGTGIFAVLPPASQQQIVSVTVQGLVAQSIPLEQCTRIDTVIGLMAPLSPRSTATLLALFIDMAAENRQTAGATIGGLHLCRN